MIKKKKALKGAALGAAALAMAGCGASTSGRVNVNPDDFKAYYNSKFDKCFVVTASRKGGTVPGVARTTGLGMTEVECDDKVVAGLENKGAYYKAHPETKPQ